MCVRTRFKNCSCFVCRKRKPEHVEALLNRHRSVLRQEILSKRTGGLVPTYLALQNWYSLDLD